jgi:hypothetical protein
VYRFPESSPHGEQLAKALRILGCRWRSERLGGHIFVFRLKLSQCLVHFVSGAGMYAWPPMKDAIYGGLAAEAQVRNFIQ